MQQFVIERQGVSKVREAEECQDQHDNESEKDEPLSNVHSAPEMAQWMVRVSPVVGGLACHKLVSESGRSASRPLRPCAGDVAHSCTSGQQTSLP